jgi:hypothetical protein
MFLARKRAVGLIGRSINMLGKEHNEYPNVLKWLLTD